MGVKKNTRILMTLDEARLKLGKPITVKNDIVSRKFGKLIVLDEMMYKRYGEWKNIVPFVKCKCDCGNDGFFSKSSLLSGNTRSCGCEANAGSNLIGKIFGNLFVVRFSHSNGRKFWECKCSCGTEKFIANGKTLINGDTQSCGCFSQNKKHIRWKGYEDIPLDFFSNCKRGAMSRNIQFEITIEYLWELYIQQQKKCALSGIDLNFSKTRKDNKNKTVSIDRKDSSKGYVVGNVQWVHKTINIMKNKLPDSVFIDFCKKVAITNNKIMNNE